MKTEPDTEKPIMASTSTDSVEGDSNLVSTKSSRFLWNACSSETQRDRIDIKQQAVLDALRLGQKVRSEVTTRLENRNKRPGIEDLADWVERFDKVKKQYETPHSTIGLIGVLGSGKSTILNAILGQRNLLPSSSDRAGTAVACRIRNNHGSDGYHAKIVFRSHQSFTDEIEKLFQSLKTKGELMKRLEKEQDSDERESIEDELEDLEESTSGTLQTLGILFGVNEDDLRGTSAKQFLDNHPLKFLGDVMNITETDLETLAAKIKPFLDSTPADHDGKDQILWPLIEDASVYLSSDFLKYGIELLDLPGSGDTVERRARVAERFTKDLDITVLVAPAVRATEEKTVIGFIKKRQENEMRMDGKFDRNSLCVVLSKSEDLNAHEYLKEKWIAKDYPGIKKHLDRAEMLDKIIRAADSGLGASKTEPMDPGTSTSMGKDNEVEKHRQELLTLTESLKQAAVYIRNRSVSERIQQDFRVRRAANKPPKDDQHFDDTIEVLPTSARAFQAIRYPGSMKETGFQHECDTGIPQLKQWLHEATFQKREEHLNGILKCLSSLFTRIRNWSTANENQQNQPGMPAHGSHDFDHIHEQHCQSLTLFLRQSSNELRQIEPLKAKTAALAECQSQYPRNIIRWRFRYPNKINSALKIHGNIQTCILRRDGDAYESKGKFTHEYSWVDDLETIFINKILDDWKYAYQKLVPEFETKIQKLLEHAWQDYSIALDNFCIEHNATQPRSREKIKQTIHDAKANLENDAHRVLRNLQRGAQDIHPLFRKEIQRILKPCFQQALAIKGKGCMKQRNELMKKFAEEHSANMAVKACETVETALAELIQQHAKELEGLAADSIPGLQKQIKGLLGVSKRPFSSAARMNQERLMKEIRPHLRSWELCWQKPSSQREDHVMRGDLSIPDPDLIKVKIDEDDD